MPSKDPVFLSPSDKACLHPDLNEGVDTDKLPISSPKKLWWKCEDYPHAYFAPVRHKMDGQGCSVCSGKQILAGFNDLETLRPDIAAQWHPTKNGALQPSEIPKTYSKKVWWVCKNGHEFESLANNRRTSSHCPVCSGKTVLSGYNDVATLYPSLVEFFHPELNGDIELTGIGKGYAPKLWWRRSCGHDVHVRVSNCLNEIPCSYCSGHKVLPGFNDLAVTNPEIVHHWHPTKNHPLTPQNVTKASKTKIWWICDAGHEDLILPANKIKIGARCSYCDKTKFLSGMNDIATIYPEASKEWHPVLNGTLTPADVAVSSSKKFWWHCGACEQDWEATPHNRGSRGTGCPYCAGTKIKEGVNDLLTFSPSLASQWHPTRNGALTPKDVTKGQSIVVWWQCKAGHEWDARIVDRVNKASGCIECYKAGLTTGTVSFAESHPYLLDEWDYSKNDRKPEFVSTSSSKKYWWVCSVNKGHCWEATLANRTTKNSGCPTCWKESNGSQAEEDLAAFLVSLGIVVERNVRTLLGDKAELDIYLPEFNTGIEYNGLYWHSEAGGKDRKYHVEKYKKCQEHNINLIQIWEDEWLYKNDIVLRHLAYRFKKMEELKRIKPEMDDAWFQKHHARKLSVSEISGKESANFLEQSHIQGKAKGSYYYGLKAAGRIVAVIVMEKTNTDGTLLLSRYATQGSVVGGFTKLLSHVMRTLAPERIITFSDNSTFDGGLYRASGFIHDGTIPEDYMYIRSKKRHHKFGFRLARMKNNPQMKYIEGLTEKELANLNGFSRVWDSGKIRWVLARNKSESDSVYTGPDTKTKMKEKN